MEFGLLGPLSARADGGGHLEAAPKQLSLLAALLLAEGRVLRTDRIIDMLWGDSPPSGGERTLRFHVSKLRGALDAVEAGAGALVATHPGGYSLNLPAVSLDIHRFRSFEAEIRATSDPMRRLALCSDALSLFRGSPLSDFEYEDWAQVPITELSELRLQVVERRCELLLEAGEHDRVISELAPLIAANPFRERLRALTIVAYYRSGRQAEALQCYRDAARVLGEELGIEPSPELRLLEEQVLLQDPALGRADAGGDSAVGLPDDVTRFVGREAEVRTVARLFTERGRRVVVLVGLGGIGKTRLAIRAAARLASDRLDDAVFVGLASVVDEAGIDAEMSRALGLRERPGVSQRQAVLDHLRTSDVLIVLDNCEQVPGAVAELVRSVVTAAPKVGILATSRLELPLQQVAQTWRVPPMQVDPEDVSADPDALELFFDRAYLADPDFAVDAGSKAAVAALCRELAGIPLAIELAANRVASMTVAEIVDDLRHPGDQPADGSVVQADRPRTLSTVLEWTFEQLREPTQRLLAAAAVFAGSFDASSMSDLIGALDPSVPASECLDELVRAGLVERFISNGRSRYRTLAPIRLFGRGRLSAMGMEAQAFSALGRLSLRTAKRMAAELLMAPNTVDVIAEELDNIRTAMQYAMDHGDPFTAGRIASTLDYFWLWSGKTQEGRRWLGSALAVLDGEPRYEESVDGAAVTARLRRASVRSSSAFLASVDGDYAHAESSFGASLSELRSALSDVRRIRHDVDDLGSATPDAIRRRIGWTCFNCARNLTAMHLTGVGASGTPEDLLRRADIGYRNADRLLTRFGYLGEPLYIRPFMGWHAFQRGDTESAIGILEECIHTSTAVGIAQPVALAQANLALILVRSDEPEGALPILEAAIKAFEQARDLYSLQIAHTLAAVVCWRLGQSERATDALACGLAVMEAQGSREWQSLTIGVAAVILTALEGAGAVAPLVAWLDSVDRRWGDTVETLGVEVAVDHRSALGVPAGVRPSSAWAAARLARELIGS